MLTKVPEEFLNVFRVASKKELVFTLDSKKAAERMRFKFNKIRAQMRQQEHPDLAIAERVTFSVRGNTLVALPQTGDFLDEISKALAGHTDILEQAKREMEADTDAFLKDEATRLMGLQRKKDSAGQMPESVKKMLKG